MTNLFVFDSFEEQEKKELKIRTKSAIMSLFGKGPQLIDNSDPLLVSFMNSFDISNISKFNPVHGVTFYMSLCSNVDNTIKHDLNYTLRDDLDIECL